MKNYNEEYFYLKRSGARYPLLDYYLGNSKEVYKKCALDDTTEIRVVRFGDPIPRKPLLGDLHSLIMNAPAISGRLKNVLEELNLKDMQFLPATILDNKENEHEGFFIIHNYNIIRCMDKEKSDYKPSPWNKDNAIDIETLVLDNEVLDKIPLEERLVFTLGELGTHVLYHHSVVEKILAIKPAGLMVYQLSTYNSSLPFMEEYMAGYTSDDED